MQNSPKIPNFIIPSKTSPVAPDISPIKRKIRKRFGDQVYIDENIFSSFLALRTECCKYPNDEKSLSIIKRYYAHLLLLKNRIDFSAPKLVEWPWQDAFYQKQFFRTEINYEEAAILYCLGTAHSAFGQKESRADEKSMKAACTHFQCAAYVFQTLRERYGSFPDADDMSGDLFHIYGLILLNQTQECIMEKSIADSRPPGITAKLAKYLAESYGSCLTLLKALKSGSVPSWFLKDWVRILSIKKFYYTSLVDFFLASENAAEMKFGVAVAHLKLARANIEEAWHIARTFTDALEPLIGQGMIATIRFAQDIIVNDCLGAVKDNSQIYHERVPQPEDLRKIEGTCLAKPIAFDPTDPAVIGEDIFKDLLPMEILESRSVYSEIKADFLRKLLIEIEEKDSELNSFLTSLNLDPKELLKPDLGLPQVLLDQCAKFGAMKRSPESALSAQMSTLVDISVDVEADLEDLSIEIQAIQERLNAVISIVPPSKTNQLKEQLIKATDRHEKFVQAAGEAKQSNVRLHEALTEHIKTLRILTLSPDEIDAGLPNANDLITDTALLESLDEAARILSKVEEMRAQRIKILATLRDALQADDVTSELLVADSTTDHAELFQRHLQTHQEAANILRLNLAAQENITKALITAHASIGVKKHEILDRRCQRGEKIDALIRSGESYDDLLIKCEEGQTFYRDIGERLQTLRSDLEQVRLAIQRLEPQQTGHLISPSKPAPSPTASIAVEPSYASASLAPPTLRDVLRSRQPKSEGNVTLFQPKPGAQPPVQQGNVEPARLSLPSATQYSVSSSTNSTLRGQYRPVASMPPSQILHPVDINHFSRLPTPVSFHRPQLQEQQPSTFALQQQQQQLQRRPPFQPYGDKKIAGLPLRTQWTAHAGAQPITLQQYGPSTPVKFCPSTPANAGQFRNPTGAQTAIPGILGQQQYRASTPGMHQGRQLLQNPSILPGVPLFFSGASIEQQYRPSTSVQPCLSAQASQQPLQYLPSGVQTAIPGVLGQQHYRLSNPGQICTPLRSDPQVSHNSPFGIQVGIPIQPRMLQQCGLPNPAGGYGSSAQMRPFLGVPPQGQQTNGQQNPRQIIQLKSNAAIPQQYCGAQHYPRGPPHTYQQQQSVPYNSIQNAPSKSPLAFLQSLPQQQKNQQGHALAAPQNSANNAGGILSNNSSSSRSGPLTTPSEQDAGVEKAPSTVVAPPMVVGCVPEPVALFEESRCVGVDEVVSDASLNLGKAPISPHILTQADLEVQRREKQLRATYNAVFSSPVDSSFAKRNCETSPKKATTSNSYPDPLSDPLALSRFVDATERLLTWLETMHDPPQGGGCESSSSPLFLSSRPLSRLDQSWSRVIETAANATGKRPTQAAARCCASKNRSHECTAYDFNRVKLNCDALENKDDYINASHLDFAASLGEWCPRYILTQGALPTTVADFWNMIFQQACELVILAIPPRRRTSFLPSSIDPFESYAEGAYGEPSSSLRVPPHLPPLKIGSRLQIGTGSSSLELHLQAVKFTRFDALSQQPPNVDSISQATCIERILTLRKCDSQQTHTIVHLCYSGQAPVSNDLDSIASFTAFVHTAIGFYKQQRSLTHPIAVVSEDGGGLGGIFVAASAAILHAEVLGRMADICELVRCLCQQRRGACCQAEHLATTCAVIGLAAKQSLARRVIVVGPSSNSVRRVSSSIEDAAALTRKTQNATSPDAPDFTASLFSDQPLQLAEMMSALGFAPTLPQATEDSTTRSPEAKTAETEGIESNSVFDDLPSHLVNLASSECSTDGSPTTRNMRRHYQARDFVDKAYKESRDTLAADSSLFADLNQLQ